MLLCPNLSKIECYIYEASLCSATVQDRMVWAEKWGGERTGDTSTMSNTL